MDSICPSDQRPAQTCAVREVRRKLCLAATFAIASMAGACSLMRPKPAPVAAPAPPAPPPPPPPRLSIRIDADTSINPDIRGRPSPVVLRLYALTSLTAFDTADFMSLYSLDRATLGGELIEREELMLEPGEMKVIDKLLPPQARAVGVVAGFRDVQRATWRTSQALIGGRDNSVNVRVQRLGVSAYPTER
jgi:type VI secretion system protein VasD